MLCQKVGVANVSHTHIFDDGDTIIESNCDIIYRQHLQRSQLPYGSEEIHHSNIIQNIGSKVNAL